MRVMKIASVVAVAMCSWMTISAAAAEETPGRVEKAGLRIGIFDSRAVAVAYAASDVHNRLIKQMMEQHAEAKAAGDKQKVAELEARGKAQQDQLHQQGFGTASVAGILETIKDQLPAIARQAGVDLIVSRWDVVYQTPGVELTDITGELVKPFNPSARTLKTIEELQKLPPVSLEELKRLKD